MARYKVHTFTSSNNFAISSVTGNPTADTVEFLIVAGGGGGGTNGGGGGPGGGGGGGAGGFVEGNVLVTSNTYIVGVGAGGQGGSPGVTAPALYSGSSSYIQFDTANVTATGGGGGGYVHNSDLRNGAPGGSGGGGGNWTSPGSGGAGAPGSVSPFAIQYGNPGGAGGPSGSTGGGGGGAGGAGAAYNGPATGGIGKESSITGTATYYAGGGGGGNTAGTGGQGGGGDGGGSATEGDPNTGGGGGGGSPGGEQGGSGIVIVRYPIVDPTVNAEVSKVQTVTESSNTISKGSPVTFSISTRYASNGETLFYTANNIANADITAGNTGSITITENSANLTITPAIDTSSSIFTLKIRRDSVFGLVLKESAPIILETPVATHAWHIGGEVSFANSSTVDRLDFANDTNNAAARSYYPRPAAYVTTASTYTTAYGFGGSPSGASSSQITRLTYSNDTFENKGYMTLPKYSIGSIYTQETAWISGGRGGGPYPTIGTTGVNRLTFVNDTENASARTDLARYNKNHGGWNTEAYGYHAGGQYYTYITRMAYSTDTEYVDRAYISTTRTENYAGTTTNPAYGWIYAGGITSIDRYEFATDTSDVSVRGFTLFTYGTPNTRGNNNYGWAMGGRVPIPESGTPQNSLVSRSDITRLTYADDTMTMSVRSYVSVIAAGRAGSCDGIV